MTSFHIRGDLANIERTSLATAEPLHGRPSAGEDGRIGCFAEYGEKVLWLRESASRQMLALRAEQHTVIDPESTSALAIVHQDRRVAGKRVELVHDGRAWRVRDWDAVAELKQDGHPAREVSLLPGMEISIAGRVFVAESERTLQLHRFCSRLLGWGDDRLAAVDHAVRAIRLASVGRSPLVLRGNGDLVAVADSLHRYARGDTAPFIVSDPRRRAALATVRSPANVPRGIDGFHQAYRGTLCLRMRRLPSDFDKVLSAFRESEGDVQITICAQAARARDPFSVAAAAQIDVPSLRRRPAEELERIVSEYVEDAIERLEAPRDWLQPRDIAWIMDRAAIARDLTIPDIEKAVFRLVAVRTAATLSKAADMLGMAPVSLQRWLARRGDGLRYAAEAKSPKGRRLRARRSSRARSTRRAPGAPR